MLRPGISNGAKHPLTWPPGEPRVQLTGCRAGYDEQGAFDPLLLSWASREAITGPHRRIVTVNGLFRPFALAGGRAVATWSFAGGQVALAPFAPLDAETRQALETDAADVTRFLGA